MIAFNESEYRQRIRRLQASMESAELRACVCIAPELLYYFSGYDGHTHFSDQALIVGVDDDEPTFVYRDVDAGLAGETCWLKDQRTYHYGEREPFALIVDALRERVRSSAPIGVGFDTHALKGAKALLLRDRLSAWHVKDASALIEQLRLRKSDAELNFIREAARLADAGLERALAVANPGMSEIDLAGHIEHAMREQGSEYPAMPAWVASGARTRGAHKTPSDKRIDPGDRVKLEFAGVSRRYHAVTMQTFWIAERPSKSVQTAYETAMHALRAGESAISIGTPVAESEAAAFAVLAEKGFDLRWHSRFGYGVGIAYPPTWLETLDITRESTQRFERNQSFTLHVAAKDPEQGLGLMLGGAYILTDAGVECLSGGSLELVVV